MKSATLISEIQTVPFRKIGESDTRDLFLRLAAGGKVVMDENPYEHICVYTLPYHKKSKQVLLGHHIKADKWLVPGGHIDTGETIARTAVREVQEEMGIAVTEGDISSPFHAEIAAITSKPPRFCKKHYSIWVFFSSPSNSLVLDPSEFYESRWFGLSEAIEKTTDRGNKEALQKFSLLRKQ